MENPDVPAIVRALDHPAGPGAYVRPRDDLYSIDTVNINTGIGTHKSGLAAEFMDDSWHSARSETPPPPPPYWSPQHQLPPLLPHVEPARAPSEPGSDSDSDVDIQGQGLPDVGNDPFYRIVRAETMGVEPNRYLPLFCINFNRISYMLYALLCFPVFRKRKGTPGDSPHLHRAYLCGWRMLLASVFPLAPGAAVRCIWTVLQFVLFAVVLCLSVAATLSSKSGCSFNSLQLTAAAVAVTFACIDMVIAFSVFRYRRLRARRTPENQPLLQGHYQRAEMHVFLPWLSKYWDLVRLVVMEVVSFLVLALNIPNASVVLNPIQCHSGNGSQHVHQSEGLDTSLLAVAAAAFVCVCLAQFHIILRILFRVVCQQFPRSRSKHRAWILFIQLLLYLIGQRIIQASCLACIHKYYPSTGQPSPLLGLFLAVFFFPVSSLLFFLALDYGWLEDLCTSYCGDYLRWLSRVSRNPQTPQEVRHEMTDILQHFDYRALRTDIHELDRNYYGRNLLYPVQSPLVQLFYCVPYWSLIGMYLALAVMYGACGDTCCCTPTPPYYDCLYHIPSDEVTCYQCSSGYYKPVCVHDIVKNLVLVPMILTSVVNIQAVSIYVLWLLPIAFFPFCIAKVILYDCGVCRLLLNCC